MLGVALALVAVGAATGFAYLTRRFPLSAGESGGASPGDFIQPDYMDDPAGSGKKLPAAPPPGPGAATETPADQLVREPNSAGVTNPQAGATDLDEAIDAQQRANAQIPRDRGANPDLDSAWQPPDQDLVSESSLKGIGAPLDMICGGGEDDPEYQDSGYTGPPIE